MADSSPTRSARKAGTQSRSMRTKPRISRKSANPIPDPISVQQRLGNRGALAFAEQIAEQHEPSLLNEHDSLTNSSDLSQVVSDHQSTEIENTDKSLDLVEGASVVDEKQESTDSATIESSAYDNKNEQESVTSDIEDKTGLEQPTSEQLAMENSTAIADTMPDQQLDNQVEQQTEDDAPIEVSTKESITDETVAIPVLNQGGANDDSVAAAVKGATGPGKTSGGSVNFQVGASKEFKGGTAQDGENEIEKKLANADPERSALDELDSVDSIGSTESIVYEQQYEPESALTEIKSKQPDFETLPDKELNIENATTDLSDNQFDVPQPEISEFGDMPETSEVNYDLESIDNLDTNSASEAQLDIDLNAPDLSKLEQNISLDSIGESVGGSGPNVGGGGAGTSLPKPQPIPVPDVATMEPGAALSKAASLPVVQMQQTLTGVGTSVAKSSADKRVDLAANLPQKQRPSGAPKNLHSKQQSDATEKDKVVDKVEQAPEGNDIPTPELQAFVEPAPSPAEKIVTPQVSGSEQGELTENEVARLSNSIDQLPVRDPASDAAVDQTPNVELSGNADPVQVDTQRAELHKATTDASAQGKRDAAAEMGENTKVYPSFAPETLVAKLPEQAESGKASVAGGVGKNSDAISIIVQEQKSSEIQTEVAKAQGDMATKQTEYNTSASNEKTKSNEEMAELEKQSSVVQAQARSEVQSEVRNKKGEWTKEQDKVVTDAEKEANTEVTKTKADIKKEKESADNEAKKEIDKGNREAEAERQKAEQKAQEAKKKGKEKKSGFFGWLASKATAFFNKIKSAIKSAFAYARKMIKKVIEAAKKLALWAIEKARQAIVAAIKLAGKALIAIGDHLLAAFPEMRNRFRKFINDKVDKAVNKVNEYAEQLKKDVAKALDALAAGLDKLVGWLEKGLLAVVDGVAAVVNGAIKFAEKVANAVGAFLSLIKDVAVNPLKWLSNLGAAVVDGIKNHLWKAFKAAVQEWFNSKLEQVLGLGTTVWNLIKSGGLKLAMVGKMAWEGIKTMIPMALVSILVEKLVAMIVPVAGALMVIIEGLQAAWGTVSRIIAAFKAFFAFLKAVKTGAAGPKFATALVAAAIAVIDFVSNWLLIKLAKGAAKVGGKIKGLAKKILGRRKGKLKGRKLKGRSKSRKSGKSKKTKTKKAGKSKKPKQSKSKKSAKDKKADKKKENERKKRDRLAKSKRELPPKIKRLLDRGVSRVRLKVQLGIWRLKYRIKSLKLEGSRSKRAIVARNSPPVQITPIFSIGTRELLDLIRKVGKEVYEHEKTRKGAKEIEEGVKQTPKKDGNGSTLEPVDISGKGMPALARYMREREQPRAGTQRIFQVGTAKTQNPLVREQVMPFSKKGTGIISHAFRKDEGGFGKIDVGKYSDAVGPALKDMDNPKEVAATIRAIVRGENPQVSGKFAENIPHLTAVTTLMFGAEGSRSSSAFVTSMMTTELMAKGMLPEKALNLMPMAPLGAVQSARDVDENVASNKSLESLDSNAKKMVEQEIKLVQTWVNNVAKQHEFDDEQSLERFIREKVMQFFRLNSPSKKK